jgi:transcriptional regulator with XRE-family HTH domain
VSKEKDSRELPPFAVRLKALREEAGMTQAQLAEASGLHLGAVFKLEQGVRDDPSWSTVRALAKALGTDCTAFDEDANSKTKVKRKT